MEKSIGTKRILVHQAIFGEKNRRHVLLAHSFNDQKILNELERLSDRPDHSTDFPPFTIGYITENRKHYCLMRIMVDPQTERQGMAFAHALIFSIDEIIQLNSIEPIYNLFAKTTHKPLNESLEPLELLKENVSSVKPAFIPVFNNVIHALVQSNENKPIIWLGYDHTDDLIRWLWYNLTPGMRRNFAFKLAEKPEKVKPGYTLVFTPESSSYYWQHYNLVSPSSIPLESERLSLSAKLLCGEASAQDFRTWIENHRVTINSILDLQQCERTYVSIVNAKQTGDAFMQSIAVRELGTIFPTIDNGVEIKESIFDFFLGSLSKTNSYKAIVASRNLPLDAYSQGQYRFISALEQWLNQKFFSENTLLPADRLEVLGKAIDIQDISPNWWKQPIQLYIQKKFAEPTALVTRQFFEMGLMDPGVISKLEQYINNSPETESRFVESFPENNSSDFVEAAILLSKQKKWYLLHAHIISTVFPIQDALSQQLKIDKDSKYLDAIRHIAARINDKEFIAVCNKFEDDRLFQIAGELCSKNTNLLLKFDFIYPQERKILFHAWQNLIAENKLPDLQSVVFKLFDLLLTGQIIESELMQLISQSRFANLYEYPKREMIWDKIEQPYFELFRDLTLSHVLSLIEKRFLSFAQVGSDLQIRLFNSHKVVEILADRQISTWLKIQLISQVSHLPDSSVSAFIRQNFNAINDQDAITLGRFILKNHWKESASLIYKIYKEYGRFHDAYLKSRHLVGLRTKWAVNLGLTENLSFNTSSVDLFVTRFQNQVVTGDIVKAIDDFIIILNEAKISDTIDQKEITTIITMLNKWKSDWESIKQYANYNIEDWEKLERERRKIRSAFLDFLTDLPKRYKSFCRAIEQDL